MALEVEDGTGKSNADTYASLDTAAAYATAHGLTFAVSGVDEVPAEAALRRAAKWLDAYVLPRLNGTYRTHQRDQALAWPRAGVVDREGNGIGIDEVPVEIVDACCEAAIFEKSTPGGLSPSVTPGKIKRRVEVSGAVSVDYHIAGGSVEAQRPLLTIVDDILAGLLGPRQSGYFGKAVRG